MTIGGNSTFPPHLRYMKGFGSFYTEMNNRSGPGMWLNAKQTAKAATRKPLAVILTAAILCSASLYAHHRIALIGEDYTGALAPLDRVFDVLLALGLLVITFCIGRLIGKALALDFVSTAEELAFSVMLGTGTVALCVFVLGLLRMFKPVPIAALLILLLVIARREAVGLYQTFNNVITAAKTEKRRIAFLLFVALVLLLATRAAEPPHAVDDAICHLAVPKEFIKAGGIVPLYDNFPSNMPLLIHMIYVICLAAKSDAAAAIFSLALAIATGLSIYAFCARFLNRATGLIALFGFFGAGVILEVAITARIDVTLAGMLFLAAYAMIIHLETDKTAWLWASALLSGFSLSVKYTSAAWIGLMGLMYLYEGLFKQRKPFPALLRRGAVFAMISFAIVAPWLIKNWVYFKNPVYPFVTGEVADYGPQGIRYFTEQDERKMDGYLEQSKREIPEVVALIGKTMADIASRRESRHPLRVWEYVTNSELYNMGLAEVHHDPNYLFLVSPLLFFLPRKRWLVWSAIFCGGFFLFAASSSWLARYQLPFYPSLTVLSAYVLTSLSDRFRHRSPLSAALPIAAVAVTVCLTLFIFAVQIYRWDGVKFLTGSLSRREFLQNAYYYPPIDYVNRNTPEGARVMMVGMETAYHVQRSYVADPAWDSVEWQRLMVRNNSFEEINEELKRRGISYVVFDPGLYRFIAAVGRAGSGPAGTVYSSPSAVKNPDYQVQFRNWATFELYRIKFLDIVFQREGGGVFKVNWSGRPRTLGDAIANGNDR